MSAILDFWAKCSVCGVPANGRLHIDDSMRLSDSDGGALFADGWRCHGCLGEPWAASASLGQPGETK
jgi:hypothetical protein